MTPPSVIDVTAPAVLGSVALVGGALAGLPTHQVIGALMFAGGWLAGAGWRALARRAAADDQPTAAADG